MGALWGGEEIPGAGLTSGNFNGLLCKELGPNAGASSPQAAGGLHWKACAQGAGQVRECQVQ